MNRNSSGFKALFTFRNLILDVKSTILMHSNSLNVSAVSLCDSFDGLSAFVLFKQSIGEGKRGNEFAQETIKGTERASPIYTLFHR